MVLAMITNAAVGKIVVDFGEQTALELFDQQIPKNYRTEYYADLYDIPIFEVGNNFMMIWVVHENI